MDNCPKCGTVLVEHETPFDQMSDGQQFIYNLGFVDKICQNCGNEIEDTP
jgi:ribosomal protein S27AE